jgi:hypothetical protein
LPLKERLVRLEQLAKASKGPESNGDANDTRGTFGAGNRGDQAGLKLSQEEIQLIRSFIIPAPLTGPATPAINAGDPITGAMIPLPSQLIDKVPKLAGAKFTTRNGAIVISGKDSNKADLVLAPN